MATLPETEIRTPDIFETAGVRTVKVEEGASAKKLMEECGAIKVGWTWMRTGLQVDKGSKAEMAAAADTTVSGFSASKRLMDSSHPVVKEANALRSRISGYIRAMSLPITQIDNGQKKEGGSYLIKKREIADFMQRMRAFQSELSTAEQKINDNMPSIMESDRQRLGDKLFKREDYGPVRLQVRFMPVNMEPPKYLEEYAPELFEEAKQKAAQWWEGIYSHAVIEFMREFHAVMASWVEALGPVVKIFPPETHPLERMHGGEIRREIRHKDDPSIPDGHVRLTVRYRKGGEKKLFVEEEIGPLSGKEYAELQPNEQAEKIRTFKNSTVENLLDMVTKFRRLGSTISASAGFTSLVNDVEAQIQKAGMKPAEVAEELRKSKVFRGGTHALVQQLSNKLASEIDTFERKRRKIDFIGADV